MSKTKSIVYACLSLSSFFLIVSSTILFGSLRKISAQQPNFNIATTMMISDNDVSDGDILSLTDGQQALTRSKVAYDEKMFGVATDNPMMVYRTRDTLPVARSGYVSVNITSLGGPINAGDFITSSPIQGKGQKATDMSGYVLGVAIGSFEEKDGKPIDFEGKKIYAGKVMTSVGIGPASPVKIKAAGGLFGTFKFVLTSLLLNLQTAKETARIIRYVIAAFVAVITILVNFFTFGRNITKGIESIGRNPLAKVSIQSMIVLNLVLVGVVSLGGIVLSLVIISL